jgi:hypothetical protein
MLQGLLGAAMLLDFALERSGLVADLGRLRAKACARRPISPPAAVGIAVVWPRANPSTAWVIWTSGLVSDWANRTAKASAMRTAASPTSKPELRTAMAVAMSSA